mmetsp:Transcript_48975/g.98544  ORF Transcript_48975/g.98544 Transcript_48975/m.98544 type:complete len:449 (-) Transcript_48975:369-1715(-)
MLANDKDQTSSDVKKAPVKKEKSPGTLSEGDALQTRSTTAQLVIAIIENYPGERPKMMMKYTHQVISESKGAGNTEVEIAGYLKGISASLLDDYDAAARSLKPLKENQKVAQQKRKEAIAWIDFRVVEVTDSVVVGVLLTTIADLVVSVPPALPSSPSTTQTSANGDGTVTAPSSLQSSPSSSLGSPSKPSPATPTPQALLNTSAQIIGIHRSLVVAGPDGGGSSGVKRVVGTDDDGNNEATNGEATSPPSSRGGRNASAAAATNTGSSATISQSGDGGDSNRGLLGNDVGDDEGVEDDTNHGKVAGGVDKGTVFAFVASHVVAEKVELPSTDEVTGASYVVSAHGVVPQDTPVKSSLANEDGDDTATVSQKSSPSSSYELPWSPPPEYSSLVPSTPAPDYLLFAKPSSLVSPISCPASPSTGDTLPLPPPLASSIQTPTNSADSDGN